ncbi:aminopeptidase [Fictibacillus sp. B-59209]|uniref:aminopeptidase n=1 Tax=Fictibacillus sp. B-59209 TaxID=3024873 RepID=UPI002E23CB21|nr:aminopeptidase [Fictibacillus sp. B-59209]
MRDFQLELMRYAEIIVKIGLNIQKGQTLVVFAPVSAVAIVRLIVKTAYESGAYDIYVDWNDDEIVRLKYELASEDSLKDYPMFKLKGIEELIDSNGALLFIRAPDPELFSGIDPKRIIIGNKTVSVALSEFQQNIMTKKLSWSLVAVPSKAWAAKVFPDLEESEGVGRLWEAIFKATRADLLNPIQEWEKHNNNLKYRVNYLNSKKYRCLSYYAPGTKLSIELPENHIWHGGEKINNRGASFYANIPTEEVFTAPLKNGVNGIVSSTKPLSNRGILIENFTLTFKNGKIIDFTAEVGYDALKRIIETDEGSCYIGEVALVPHNSPISESNLIYYHTLFDENASCHLAIGNAYPFCIEGGVDLDREHLAQQGINTSNIHVDFMIGSGELDIYGESSDGTKEQIICNGKWMF